MNAALLLLWLAPQVPPDEPPRLPQIEARHWFNNPPFRLRDERTAVLIFFKTDDPGAPQWVATANRLSRRAGTVVVGLTRDDQGDAKRFVEKYRVRFTVGAGSDCAEEFGVREYPAVRRVRASGADPPEALRVGDLAVRDAQWGSYGQEDVSRIERPEDLKAFIDSDAYGRSRKEALWKLFRAVPADEFLAFVDTHLTDEVNPMLRGSIEFLRLKAAGAPVGENEPAPSSRHYRAYGENPSAPEWREVREFEARLKDRSAAQLLDDYDKHAADDPADIVIRRVVVDQLLHAGARAEVRAAYLRWLPLEPDYNIRLRLAAELGDLCGVGDVEAADLLEELARTEPNILHVRPMMEYMSRYIRTGQEDPDR